jgi:hypothetical protein
MATFQDFSLVKKEIEFIRKRNNIDEFSRAFIFAVLEKLYPDIEQEDYITDGAGDLSIDAYYIDDIKKEINIFQFKSTENFETAKDKEAFKEGDIAKIIVNIEKVWNRDKNILKGANNKAADAINAIWEALDKGYTKTNVWFISNYKTTIRDENKIDRLKENFLGKFRATLKIYSLDDIVNLILSYEFKPVDVKLQIKGRNYFEDISGKIRALIAEVNAFNFLKSIIDKNNNLKENVFNENIRVYLKKTTKINKQIYSSIENQEENFNFFFYNNGITAICDSYEHANTDSPVVSVKNFQIVNGGQTIHAIYEAYKNGLEENVKNIYLLLRLYEVKDRSIGQAIARYTNTQNPVRSRDIMANDDVQIKLQQELRRRGWYYERKRYEFRDSEIENEKKIDAEKLGQVILSFYLEKPGSAKNKKQEVFGTFYNEIFDENKITAEYVLLPYLLYKDIEKDIKKFEQKIRKLRKENKIRQLKKILEKDEFLLYAHYYLLATLKLVAEKKSIELKLENKKKIFDNYDNVKNILRKLIREKKKDPKFSMPYLFKGEDFLKEIKEKILNRKFNNHALRNF